MSDGFGSVLRIRVGRAWIGWPADRVEQVTAWLDPTPLPRSPSCLLGLVAQDTKLLAVIDAVDLLDLQRDPAAPSRMVVVRLGDDSVALPAQEVRGVGVPEPAPGAEELRGNAMLDNATAGPGRLHGELLWVIDPEAFAAIVQTKLKP